MEETLDRNKMISENEDVDDYTFEPNFINTPWDDRTRRSKIGIICLLLAIFFATMACVINNIIMHYNSAAAARTRVSDKVNCRLEKIDKYNFVARIMSPSENLICIGAMMSDKSILTSEVCTKSGPIYLLLGRTTLPKCKKGFLIDNVQPVMPPGILSSNLAILKSVHRLSDCGTPIKVGSDLNWNQPVTVIGRPSRSGKSLSRQSAILMRVNGEAPRRLSKKFNMDKVLCVRGMVSCPVQAGDLLLQNGFIYGVASISIGGPNQIACFLDIKDIDRSLRRTDMEMIMSKNILTSNLTNFRSYS